MSDTGYGDFEFERRFVVRELPPSVLTEPSPALIVQSYLLAADGYAVRVRLQSSQTTPGIDAIVGAMADDLALTTALLEVAAFDFAAVTVKGPMVGGTRYEAEREIDVSVARELVRRGGQVVVKRRYSIWWGADGWVVDLFAGSNAPLIVAEVERGGPVVNLEVPAFCVSEVTDDPRFANDSLARRPYSQWADEFARELAVSGPRFLTDFGVNSFDTDARRTSADGRDVS